jgi:hypothetical protein
MLGDNLVISFDIAVRIDDTTFEDEDLVFVTGMVPPFLSLFAGADAGVPAELDLDAADVLGSTRILVSFDGSGVVGTVRAATD